jgi:hypothetical protein
MKKLLLAASMICFGLVGFSKTNSEGKSSGLRNEELKNNFINIFKSVNTTGNEIATKTHSNVKCIKLCRSTRVRSVANCPIGQTGGGVVTFTMIAYNSDANGNCTGATEDNLIWANTETTSFCYDAP